MQVVGSLPNMHGEGNQHTSSLKVNVQPIKLNYIKNLKRKKILLELSVLHH